MPLHGPTILHGTGRGTSDWHFMYMYLHYVFSNLFLTTIPIVNACSNACAGCSVQVMRLSHNFACVLQKQLQVWMALDGILCVNVCVHVL